MKLYVYDRDTRVIVAIAEGNSNEECENKAFAYANEYDNTYTPAFGFADGLIEVGDIEYL